MMEAISSRGRRWAMALAVLSATMMAGIDAVALRGKGRIGAKSQLSYVGTTQFIQLKNARQLWHSGNNIQVRPIKETSGNLDQVNSKKIELYKDGANFFELRIAGKPIAVDLHPPGGNDRRVARLDLSTWDPPVQQRWYLCPWSTYVTGEQVHGLVIAGQLYHPDGTLRQYILKREGNDLVAVPKPAPDGIDYDSAFFALGSIPTSHGAIDNHTPFVVESRLDRGILACNTQQHRAAGFTNFANVFQLHTILVPRKNGDQVGIVCNSMQMLYECKGKLNDDKSGSKRYYLMGTQSGHCSNSKKYYFKFKSSSAGHGWMRWQNAWVNKHIYNNYRYAISSGTKDKDDDRLRIWTLQKKSSSNRQNLFLFQR